LKPKEIRTDPHCPAPIRLVVAMADFRTHICVSSVAGGFYGVAGIQAGLAWQSCLIGGALCSVSGMLPDLDSDSGIPLREAVAFSSAFVPMLMVDRLQRLGCNHETMLLITIAVYFFLRFALAEIFRRYTVHRGMWHSVPAALSAALFAFVVCSCENMNLRLFKTVAIFVGFMSHILLDEIWSVEYRRGRYTFKQSFGTALKFWSGNPTANIVSYTLLAALCFLAYKDEGLMNRFDSDAQRTPVSAIQWPKDPRSQR
jgi:membrane-bound metal-dependent hydrolase YbcI (DUF457 family)